MSLSRASWQGNTQEGGDPKSLTFEGIFRPDEGSFVATLFREGRRELVGVLLADFPLAEALGDLRDRDEPICTLPSPVLLHRTWGLCKHTKLPAHV